MFRPFRILVIGGLALLIYTVFFALPADSATTKTFDADQVASYEIEMWKAAKVHSEFSIFLNATMMLREQQRLTWFRAAQEGYSLARAYNGFVDLTGRYERVLPDLEAAAATEKAAKEAAFDPAALARAQLNWMVTARMEQINSSENVAALMAEEYGLRFHVRPDQVFDAAAPRAEAFKMWLLTTTDPDYQTIGKLLIESHRALRTGLERARAARPSPR
jgi:hypothetical protein